MRNLIKFKTLTSPTVALELATALRTKPAAGPVVEAELVETYVSSCVALPLQLRELVAKEQGYKGRILNSPTMRGSSNLSALWCGSL
jgi:hypothetical protein